MVSPASIVGITSDDLFRDINATFLNTYMNIPARSQYLGNCMRLGVPSDKRTEFYGYAESVPTIDRVELGEAVAEEALDYISYSVSNLTWGKAIGFLEEDLDDLKLDDMRRLVGGLAERVKRLPQDVFFQILNGSSSSRLLKAVPLAPDGAALHAATANGSNRFGVSGGNIQPGNGVTAAADVRSDFWKATARWRQFRDTKNQELLSDDLAIQNGVTIIAGAHLSEVMQEAFFQQLTAYQAPNSYGQAAVTNTVKEWGIPVNLWLSQKITTNDWSIWLNGVEEIGPMPIFEQIRRAPRSIDEDRNNSERARRRRILATLIDLRAGYGINIPYRTILVSNS
jgi:hypothetical protein